MPKITHETPTLKEETPKHAAILFDVHDTYAWDNGKIIPGTFLATLNVFTKKKFDDRNCHIEFHTPFMPVSTGQTRGHSGVYVQSLLEGASAWFVGRGGQKQRIWWDLFHSYVRGEHVPAAFGMAKV